MGKRTGYSDAKGLGRAMRPYLVAVAAVAVAVVVRWLLDPWLRDYLPFSTLFGAVAVAVYFGGWRVALVAAAAGFAACSYLFVEPRGTAWPVGAAQGIGLVAYCISCGLIILFGDALNTARRKVEREQIARQADQERLRLAAEAVNGIIYEIALASGQVERTRGLYEVTGHRSGDVPPTAAWWWEQIHPDDRDMVQRRFSPAEGNSIVAEYRVKHRDGRWLHVEDRAVLLRSGDGRPLKWVGCTVDVSGRKQAQADKERQEALVSGVLGSITDAFFALDEDWRFTFVNEEIVRRYGRPRDEIVGVDMWQMFPLAVGGTAWVELRRAMADRVAVDYEAFYEPWQMWFLDQAYPTADGGLAVYSRDITRRKRTEQALRTKEAELESITDNTSVLLTRCSRDLRYLFVNRACAEFFGRPREQIEGALIESVMGPQAFAAILPHVEQVLRGATVAYEAELPYAAVGPRWVQVRYVPDHDDTGQVQGWYASVQDITARKRAEESLRDSERQVREILASITSGYQIIDRHGRFTAFNDAARKLILANGRDPEMLIGQHVLEAFPHARGSAGADALLRTLSERVPTEAEHHDVAWNRWFAIRAYPTPDGGAAQFFDDITPRKCAEQEREELLARLNALIDHAPIGIALFDPALRFLMLNDRAAAADGMPKEAHLGKTLCELLPEVGGPVEAVLRRVRDTGAPITGLEVAGQTPAAPGQQRHWIASYYPVKDGGGRVLGVGAVALEVTEQKQAAQQLQESEARLRLALDSAEMGGWEWNVGTGDIIWTAKTRALFGVDAGRPITFDLFMSCLHPDDVAQNQRKTAEALATGDYENEYRVVLPGGAVRWIASRGRALWDDGQRPARMLGVVADITQRKQQEQDLAVVQRTFATLVEQCPFGIYIVDADFRIATMNAGSQTGAFANVRPAIGRPFDEAMRILWPDAVAADVIQNFRRTLDTGQPYFSRDFVNPRADIDQVEGYEWELRRLTMPDGRPGVVCYYYDSTKLRQAEQRLKEADQKKDEFLAALAHELRNPLAPIRNGLQIIKLAGGDAAAVERCRTMMERQVEQMTRLMDDLMDLSRISRSRIVLRKTRLRLAEAVHNAVDTSRPLIDERGHDLLLSVPAEAIHVEGDGTRLCQVFANLLNNAAKYTDTGGRIRLAVERQGSDVVVTVEDNGVGIPAQMLTRVFDMFAQVDRSLERSQGGLGIGLNIVKRLVEMHDGSITAQSDGPGTGSRFVVRLPMLPAVTGSDPDAGGDTMAKPAPRRRILVVDDNVDGADSLAMMLRITGNETHTARDGLEAVAVAQAFKPDVILMDIGMPRLNGLDACRRIRSEAWGQNIIMVAQTGWGQDDDKRKSQQAGFNFHMVKPVDPAALETMLAGLLVLTAGG